MPYALWVFDTFAAYNTPVSHPGSAAPVDWSELFEEATPLTWDDLDQLLAAAVNCGTDWAGPLQIWPLVGDARSALITYDLPDGTRHASLTEDVDFYRPPIERPTWADAIAWGLQAVRETGARMVTTQIALWRTLQEATETLADWERQRAEILAAQGLEPDEQPDDASDLDDAIRPYERDALGTLRKLTTIAAGRCPVCNLASCDTVGQHPIARCRCGALHTEHKEHGSDGCVTFVLSESRTRPLRKS